MKKFLWPLLVFPLFLSAQKSPFNSEAVFPARHTYSTGDTLRIMTWNVGHLVDELDDPYVNNGRENNGEIKPEKMNAAIVVPTRSAKMPPRITMSVFGKW